jgi:hypothetical protein
MLEKFLDQKRAPVCTMISLVLDVAVWCSLLLVRIVRDDSIVSGPAKFAATVMLLLVGGLLNGAVGFVASQRGEYGGAAVAGYGVLVWLVTVGVSWGLALFR